MKPSIPVLLATGRALQSSAWRSVVGCLVFGSLLSACNVLPEPQADPVRHFTLSGPADATAVADAIMVRPVQLAGHLRNRSLAVRVSANEVIYLETARWAEPLDEAITQVLRNKLGQIGGGASVTVHVQRCELVRSEGNTVQLAATYGIVMPGGPARTGVFAASPRTWDGQDQGVLVGHLQSAVNELAEAIRVAVEHK